MGTNYYLVRDVCPTCGPEGERLHIGKSSAGWCFALRVYPERDIDSLEAWKTEWAKGGVIQDEYRQRLEPWEMLLVIELRAFQEGHWTTDRLAENEAVAGPNGLARHEVDGRHCIGHGAGTWDLMAGEFS